LVRAWRSAASGSSTTFLSGASRSAAREAGLPYVDQYGWRLTKLNFAEVMAYVMTDGGRRGDSKYQRCLPARRESLNAN
jgi:hypothetical protein